MHCREVTSQLEPYLDDELSVLQVNRLRRHLAGCEHCRRHLQREERWRGLLASLPVPSPSPDFAERVLATAGRRQGRKRWSTPVAGGAMAASLALGIGLGLWLPQQLTDPGPFSSTVASQEKATELQTVRLVFNAGHELQNVELTLELPPHVELASFPGRQSLSWHVNLKPGQNVLALPLRVLFPGQGELIARLNDGTQQKVFRASIQDITKTRGDSPGKAS